MTASVVPNTCRLTVMTSTVRVDLAVPVNLSIAELLAAIVSRLGPDAADQGAAHDGWTLQRVAEPPLDPAATIAGCGLTDGTVLHLRTRSSQLPDIAFDDVLDAVGEGVRTRTQRWGSTQTSAACHAIAAAALAAGLVAALGSGPRWAGSASACGVAVVLLLAGGAVLARLTPPLPRAAGIAAAFAVAYAAVAAATAVAGKRHLHAFGAAELLAAAGAVVLVAVIGLLAIGAGEGAFVAVVGAALLAVIGAGISLATSLTAAGTAALTAAMALVVLPVVPMLAYRLSQVPLPAIPTSAADLRSDVTLLNTRQILDRVARADRLLTGGVAAIGVTTAASAIWLSVSGASGSALAGILAGICLLRARLFSGRWQRGVFLAAGIVAAIAAIVPYALELHGTVRAAVCALAGVVLALVLESAAPALASWRPFPPLTRAANVIETLLVLSVVPVALAVMGVYGAVRDLSN